MADTMMQELEHDREIVTANRDMAREAVMLYFDQIRKVLQQREKALLNTVHKYSDIKLTMLDLHQQRLQEDHMAITKTVDSLETLLHQNETELDHSLLTKGQMMEEELEVHQQSVLSTKDTLEQAKFSKTFLSFSGDIILSEPLKEAGVLNECQRKPNSNILSMQRVVVSEEEDPYLRVPSRFDDLQSNKPQEEMRIDGRQKMGCKLSVSSMLEDEDVLYQIPRDFLGSAFSVPPGALGEAATGGEHRPNGGAMCGGRPLPSETATPKPPPRKVPVPPPRRKPVQQPVPPPHKTPHPMPKDDESLLPSPPPKPGHDLYDVPRLALLQDIYDIPRSPQQGGNDLYDVPRHALEGTYDVPKKPNGHDLYDVPRLPQGHDLYDIPRVAEGHDLYDVPRLPSALGAHPLPPEPHGTSGSPQPPNPAPPPRPPKSDTVRMLQRQPIKADLFSVPPRTDPPKPKENGATNEDLYDDLASIQSTQTKPHPPVTRTVTDGKIRPIPAPRTLKRRSNTVVSKPPQSAPASNRISKNEPAFTFEAPFPEMKSADGVSSSTLPASMRGLHFYPENEPCLVLTTKQLSQPFGSEQVYPCGVCTSPINDMLVVTDVFNHCIRLVNPVAGKVIERIGKEGRSGGQFKEPSAVAMDAHEHIFVVERDNPRVQKFTSRGKYLLKFGQKALWGAQLHDPWGLALSPDDKVYVSDWEKGRIYVYQKDGRHLNTIGKDNNSFLMFPAGIVLNQKGDLLIADRGKHCVWVMSADGTPKSRIGKKGQRPGELLFPHGVAILHDGLVAVSESGNHRISVFTPTGTFRYWIGEKGTKPGMFQYPRHICVNSRGQLIVADEGNQRIQIFDV